MRPVRVKKLINSRAVIMAGMIVGLTLIATGIAQAQDDRAWAYGYITVPNVRGLRAQIWTAEPPAAMPWTSSPLGICDVTACNRLVETGWIKGTWVPGGSGLQQYAVWTENGVDYEDYNLGPDLLHNRWYSFKVLYSASAGRWEAWLDNNVVWFRYSLGWTSGTYEPIGGENNSANGWMGVVVYHPEYKINQGWTLYNYANRYMGGGGCVIRAYDYGHHAYGPASSCP
jgi:hypothetical protein